MLIYIDERSIEGDESFSSVEIEAIENIGRAIREGNHFLFCTRSTSLTLSRVQGISQKTQAVFQESYHRISQNSVMLSAVDTYLRVTRGGDVTWGDVDSKLEIQVPLALFADPILGRESVLLCENLFDCKVLRVFAKIYAHLTGMRAVNVNFSDTLGGGNTTADVAENYLLAANKLLLVVTDSDRSHPNDTIGETARRCESVVGRFQPRFAKHIVLPGRELENLLPDDVFRSLFSASVDHISCVQFMEGLTAEACFDARLHIDFKNGHSLLGLFNANISSSAHSQTWQPVVESLAAGRIRPNINYSECCNERACANPSNCLCVLCGRNNTNILSLSIELLNRHGRAWVKAMPSELGSYFMGVSRSVFAWGCAAPRQST